MKWKPTAAEKRAIRGYAAKGERRRPNGIVLEVAKRYSLTEESEPHANILLVDTTKDWENSDLHDVMPFSYLAHGIDTTSDGAALVDFYVYDKRVGDVGDLLTNVQAHVELVGGKPRLVKITGTDTPTVTGEELNKISA